MGGDQIIAHVAGDEVERRHGSALRDAWVEEFDKLIDEVRPLHGARDLRCKITAQTEVGG